MADRKIELTKRGKESLESELRNLIDVVRPEVIEQLKAARAQGDLSENADYDAARDRQAEVEHRINEIEAILASAVIIEDKPVNTKVVALGTKVTFKDLSDNTTMTVEIVGSIEANPLEGLISNECPLGVAMIGRHVGEKALVNSQTPYEVEILNIALDR